jgi:protein phosphatase
MNTNQIIVLVGISGCGKSTFADKYMTEHPDTLLLSSDKLRGVIGKSESDQSVTPQVFSIIKRNSDEAIAKGKTVMIDATSLNPKERRDYVDIAKKHNVDAIAYVFERDKATLMKNQEKRGASGGRIVPEFVIDKMLSKYVRPSTSEGFKEINLVPAL